MLPFQLQSCRQQKSVDHSGLILPIASWHPSVAIGYSCHQLFFASRNPSHWVGPPYARIDLRCLHSLDRSDPRVMRQLPWIEIAYSMHPTCQDSSERSPRLLWSPFWADESRWLNDSGGSERTFRQLV